MQFKLKTRQEWCLEGEKEALLDSLEGLVREAERHGAAAGLVEAVVAPDVAACAAAGLNIAHIKVKHILHHCIASHAAHIAFHHAINACLQHIKRRLAVLVDFEMLLLLSQEARAIETLQRDVTDLDTQVKTLC